MTSTENLNDFAAALAKAQGEMRNAALNKVNPHFRSKYADLSEIRNAVTPALSKHGLAAVQMLRRSDGVLEVVTRLVHSSGQWMESVFPIPQDVSKPQTMGSAITYGRRYTLAAICNISADEDDDANAAHEAAKPAEMPFVNGSPGASKAGSRGDYDKMVTAIRNAPTLKALDDWHKANGPAIDKLPPDWVDELRGEFVDRKAELTKALAA